MKLAICCAMSSAPPTRPTGSDAAVFASISFRAASGIAARIGVSMTPGDTAFTRTGASSSASARASDSSAPFAALMIAEFGRGRTLRNPVTSVSDPPGRIVASRATRQAPQNLPSMVARTSSIATVLNGPVRNSDKLHIVERFSLDPKTMKLTRAYVANDPVYLKGQYSGSDVIQVADAPYTQDNCKEQGFIDYSKQVGRK